MYCTVSNVLLNITVTSIGEKMHCYEDAFRGNNGKERKGTERKGKERKGNEKRKDRIGKERKIIFVENIFENLPAF
jgi:hypothetical protein